MGRLRTEGGNVRALGEPVSPRMKGNNPWRRSPALRQCRRTDARLPLLPSWALSSRRPPEGHAGEFPAGTKGPPFSVWREKTRRMAVARPPPLPVVRGDSRWSPSLSRTPRGTAHCRCPLPTLATWCLRGAEGHAGRQPGLRGGGFTSEEGKTAMGGR